MFLPKICYRTFCAIAFIFAIAITPNLYGNPATNLPISTEETCSLPAPAWIQTTNTTATTISIEWAPVSGAVDYVVEAYDGGTQVFEDYFISTDGTITGLTACTYYEIRVTARCTGAEWGTTGYHGEATQCIIIDDLMASYQTRNIENEFRDVVCPETFNLSTLREVFFQINTNALYAAQADKKFSIFEALTNVYENGAPIYLLHVKHENPLAAQQGFIFANEWSYYPCNENSLTATYVDIFFGEGSSNNVMDRATEDHSYFGRLYLSRFIENDQVMFSICPSLKDPNASIQVWTGNLTQRSSKAATSLSTDLQISPNPFTDYLSLALAAPIQETTTFHLFDLNGKLLLQKQIEVGTSGQVNIPTTDLAPGTYMARWESAQTTQTTKVIKID